MSFCRGASKSDSQTDMANCDAYAELFNDFELDVANNVLLSPGAKRLDNLIAAQMAEVKGDVDVASANPDVLSELAEYNLFSSFPNPLHIYCQQQYQETLNTSSTTSARSQPTATGSEVLFGAPQIIGRVS
ncbi:hypothetical protein F4820DRAFT_443067 [Hypoxylon rubiginosum]|uniref:Uncharacterized protein n=1 Tax=Hypoxylon rubiginosum TaxID=110542 RepID=A0ACB9ZFI7_9PEZI|nr:hypothetical protein F4820DRAFT_443067 [Hypoxylon rubiginosum]